MGLLARFGLRYNDIRSADCTSAEAVGDFVYVSGPQVSNRDQVRKANPADYDEMPAVGVVISKATPTTCLVQWMGETPPIFSGLAAGEIYYLGADARLAERPPVPSSGSMFVQPIAVALADNRAYIRPENTIIRRIA